MKCKARLFKKHWNKIKSGKISEFKTPNYWNAYCYIESTLMYFDDDDDNNISKTALNYLEQILIITMK